MTDQNQTPIETIDARIYAQIKNSKGSLATLRQLAEDTGLGCPVTKTSNNGYNVTIPGLEITGRGFSIIYVAGSGETVELAAANLLNKVLYDPHTDGRTLRMQPPRGGQTYRVIGATAPQP